MACEGDIFHEFEYGIGKIGIFLRDILRNEKLSTDAEDQRRDCVWQLQNMSNTLHMLKNYPTYENTLNTGLSQSSQDLNGKDEEFDVNDIQRSGSLPDITNNTDRSSKKTKGIQPDSDFSLSDMRELVIYDPIEEEDEEDEDEEDDELDPLSLSTSSRASIKRSRKRDSAVLFDISLGDLEDFDLAGFLTEKHSGKDWYCVLMDQHFCLFPSQDASELAYDVVILPCCQISLDDRLMRTPIFRLTQPGMAPWVLVAKDNEELKEWINALTTAASGGKYSLTSTSSSHVANERRAAKPCSGASSMHAITEEEAIEEVDEESKINPNAKLEITKTSPTEELEEKKVVQDDAVIEESTDPPLESLPPETPTSPETFGEDIYEAVEQQDNFDDDGFATDEFESGSSDNEDQSTITSPKGSPKLQQKSKKKKHIFKWLKKKALKKDRLFSSPQDGVALAGYVSRLENNECSKRWCVIREGKIYCYKNIKDEETELTLELEGTDIRAKEEHKNRFVIRVLKDNERLLTLLTKNPRDMDKWKTALRIESGFIKLTSPVDTNPGPFEESDYITPITPVGLQKSPSRSPTTVKHDSVSNEDEENGYLELKEVGNDQESLGPLPSIPKSNGFEPLSPVLVVSSGKKSPDPESLGPLPPLPVDAKPPALPPPRKSQVPQVVEEKYDENDEELEDIYEEVKIVPLPDADKLSHWHKMSFEERKQYEEENRDVPEPIITPPSSDRKSAFKTPPPLTRKVSFDDKVEVIATKPPRAIQPETNGDTKEGSHTPHPIVKPQAEVSPMQHPTGRDIRSLPKKTLKESWVKSSNVEEDDTPRNKVLGSGPKIEQDKEREILQKAEEEFLGLAKQRREKGPTSLCQKRPSIVERNRLAFESRKREEALAAQSKIIPRSQALKKEKADLLAMLEFQKKRVAVAKDRKIFFSFSSTGTNTAVADADMEFHESQLGLAKAKKRIAEIDNELKNLELLEFKVRKNDGDKKETAKTKEFRLITADSDQVKATDDMDGSSDTVRNLKRGNVLSKLKVFENMSNK